jgi:hypothetical protein
MSVKVRLLVSRATERGPENAGDEVNVPEREVWPMFDAGQCEFIDGVKLPDRPPADAPMTRRRATEKAVAAKPASVEKASA